MQELKNSDLQEMKNPDLENYRSIKPEQGTTVAEAKEFFDNEFKNPGNAGEDNIPAARNERELKNDSSEYGVGTQDSPRYIITRNEGLENNDHPITGVRFEKRIIELPNGEYVEGVFPIFKSLFDAKIPEDLYLQSDKEQFKECNRQLLKTIENDPGLKEKFSKEQLDQIRDGVYDGTAPDGYVWHHDVEAGKLQLVDFETHSHTGHTGGRSLWGGGSDNR